MIKRFHDGRDWFFEQRFGMFVHWGLYALPAWHEQIIWRSRFNRRDYEKLIHEFNPTAFEPDRWLDVLQDAGMESFCFTTKHHDGFCMWDTAFTDYNVMNTPYKKDILRMLADTCRSRGVRFGLYYSVPDWHHPNYPNLGRSHEMFGPRPGDDPDEGKYLAFMHDQVEELCRNYGEISEFFWDGGRIIGYSDSSVNDMIRGLQPNAVINNRGPDDGDYSTPERRIPDDRAFSGPAEGIQAMGRESWGYREDEDYYSHKYLIQCIDSIMAMGGNYLLNVGPMANGALPDVCVQGLRRIGKWYKTVKEAFVEPCSYMLQKPDDQRLKYDEALMTRRGNTFYVHVHTDPQTSSVVLEGFDAEPLTAVLLNTGQALSFSVDSLPMRWKQLPCLRIKGLPVNEITDEVMVVKMEFGNSYVE